MKLSSIVHDLAPILYEDDHLLAVSKPAGLDIGRLPDVNTFALTDLPAWRAPDSPLGEPANRLSRHESGVVIFPKTDSMRDHLRAGWNGGKVEQEYILVARGRFKGGKIRLPTSEGDSRSLAVEELHGKKDLRLLRCRTFLRSPHALKAALRASGLRVVGDSRGLEPGRREALEKTHFHLRKVTFHHPGLSKKLTLHGSVDLNAFRAFLDTGRDWEGVLRMGLARRLGCLLYPESDALRLLTGPVEGVPGLIVEKYADVVILNVLEGRTELNRSALRRIAHFYKTAFDARAVYRKTFLKDRSRPGGDDDQTLPVPDKPLLGDPAAPLLTIREHGLVFEIHPHEGSSVGLFLDQRDNRLRARKLAKHKRVLNLFAYTCGFSAASAMGGAHSTVSVDLSPKALDWGRRNFQLNNLLLEPHLFIVSEAFDYLGRAQRQERRFDLIILDPPTFARSKKPKRTFHVVEDLPDLIRESLKVLAPEGTLLISTNYRQLTKPEFQSLIRQGVRGRKIIHWESPPLPLDFAPDPRHAQTVLARFE